MITCQLQLGVPSSLPTCTQVDRHLRGFVEQDSLRESWGGGGRKIMDNRGVKSECRSRKASKGASSARQLKL